MMTSTKRQSPPVEWRRVLSEEGTVLRPEVQRHHTDVPAFVIARSNYIVS